MVLNPPNASLSPDCPAEEASTVGSGVSESGLGGGPVLLSTPRRKVLGHWLEGDVKSKILASTTVRCMSVKGEACDMAEATSLSFQLTCDHRSLKLKVRTLG